MTPDQQKDFELGKKILPKSDGPVGEFIRVGAEARCLVIAELLAGAGVDEAQIVEDMIRPMAESRAWDDEGFFDPLCDLLDFSGENARRTVLRFAAQAAFTKALSPILARLVAAREAVKP